MRIGTDVSIETCRSEGYMVMDYPVHALRKNPLTTDCRFTKSLPDYIRAEMGWTPGDKMLETDMWLNWEDLYEKYLENKKSIDDYTDYDYSEIEVPGPRDLLDLASDIDSYCGLV